MKLTLFIFLFLLSFHGRAASIESLVLRLDAIAEGALVVYDLQGSSGAELVMSFADQVGPVLEDTEFVFDYKYLETMDETAYGTTDAQTFANLIWAATHFMDDDALDESEKVYAQSELKEIQDVLKLLEKKTLIYSWDPRGNTVCGSMLTTPVLIDPVDKKAYALDFYKIEGC